MRSGSTAFDDHYLNVLESLLKNLSNEQVHEQSKKDGLRNAEDKLDQIIADLRGSSIFKTLLQN